MKKFIIAVLAILFIIVGLIVAAPLFFKDDLVRAVKKDLNRRLTARVDFGDVKVSLWRSFPDLYVEVRDFVIDSTGPEHNLTLASVDRFGLTMDLLKLFKGAKEIKSVEMQGAKFHVYVSPEGEANYDIMAESEEETSEEESGDLEWEIRTFTARDVQVDYEDESMDMALQIRGLNHEGRIRSAEGRYFLTGESEAEEVDFYFDGTGYLRRVRTRMTHDITADGDWSRYRFNRIDARLNGLPLEMQGEVALEDKGVFTDLSFRAPGGSLADFMTLVPAEYMPSLPELDIRGDARLEGFVKGWQTDSLYPAYRVDFAVEKGRIKGKDLPAAVENISVRTLVDFPGGPDLDATVIDMPDISFSVKDHFARGSLEIRRPLTDPWVQTAWKSKLDLSAFKDALPLEGVRRLEGRLDADFAVKGRVSDMEAGRADKVDARGYFAVEKFAYEADSLPWPVQIPRGRLNFTPLALEVAPTRILAGKSDFEIRGKVTNYLAYAMQKDSVLRARIDSRSALIDFNELSGAAPDETGEEEEETAAAPRIPSDLDITVRATADRLIFKNMDLRDVQSLIEIKDRKASLTTLLMKAFGGKMELTGLYDTSGDTPYSRLDLQLRNARIDESAESLSYMKYYTPLLTRIRGQYDMEFGVGTALDSLLNPVFSTTDARGFVRSGQITAGKIEFFERVADLLKLQALSNPRIDRVEAGFTIEKGNLGIKPFDFRISGIPSKLGGTVRLDRTLDLTWDMRIPLKMLGNRATEWVSQFKGQLDALGLPLDQIDTVYVTLKITGNVTSPSIKPVFSKGTGKQGLTATVKEAVTAVVDQKIDEAKEKAALEAEALIREAEARGDALIREAEAAARALREEAERQAARLEAEAKDPISKMAAKKAADKIRKEADKKARQLVEKARAEKQRLIEEARRKAATLTGEE
ncbi:MAG: AsmA family protein [Chlorobi bacterium]|nr:AsmA family protein [Chlorobiota bacterium]